MHHPDTEKIANLNDEARQSLTGCRVFLTRGIHALGESAVRMIIAKVQAFDEFTEANDPYGEHDFGKIELFDHCIFWKFDYYDPDMQMASLDPADPTITARVLTVMLANEY